MLPSNELDHALEFMRILNMVYENDANQRLLRLNKSRTEKSDSCRIYNERYCCAHRLLNP